MFLLSRMFAQSMEEVYKGGHGVKGEKIKKTEISMSLAPVLPQG